MKFHTSKQQEGFALVSTMLLIVILTVLGIASTNITSIESVISGNERAYNENFYLAEGAAKEAADQNLESAWVWEFNKNDFPDDGSGEVDVEAVFTQPSNLGGSTNFGVVDKDIPQGVLGSGHSLKVEGSGIGGRMNFFDLYGQSTLNNSNVRIIMGYTKRLQQ